MICNLVGLHHGFMHENLSEMCGKFFFSLILSEYYDITFLLLVYPKLIKRATCMVTTFVLRKYFSLRIKCIPAFTLPNYQMPIVSFKSIWLFFRQASLCHQPLREVRQFNTSKIWTKSSLRQKSWILGVLNEFEKNMLYLPSAFKMHLEGSKV